MKIHLLTSLFTALLFAVSMPAFSAASTVARMATHPVSAFQTGKEAVISKHLKKEKRKSSLRKWWETRAVKLFQKAKLLVQRISLGFIGLIVTLVGAMFIVLGIVIPYLGILFLVIGIIIAFVGLLLWILLSKIGVRVSSGDERDRRAN